jgi:hypothetical protein
MNRYFRYFMFALCAIQLFFAVAFTFQLPIALQVWPLSYPTQLSFIFIGSIFLAAATPTFWCLVSKEYGALSGIALDYLLIFVPITIFTLQLGAANNSRLALFSALCAGEVILGAGLLLWSIRIPIRNPRPMPRLVRWSFIFFVIALLVVGIQMVLKVPNVLPWDITAEGSVIYGWIFLGAAAYFIYALVRPSWQNSIGQLLGFLAYDVVLIGPFLARLPTIAPGRRLALLVYTAVVSYSGLLAIYYLFINPATRLWRTRPTPEAAPSK